jgi:tetratricopeptide (TPR) repeat protein
MDKSENSERGDAPAQPSDPAAWAALSAASREKADAFLDEQRALALEQKQLVRLQAEELEHELKLRHWSLRVRHLSDVLKLVFEVSLALVVVAILGLIGTALWYAHEDDGVVIDAFSVPPDMTAKGLNGQVVAGKLQGRLIALQNATYSFRAPSSYANNWGSDIKVEIPDTGVSIGEIYRFLASWLGHQTHITGEVYRTASGIAVSAHVGNDDSAVFTGSDAELGDLIKKAAESVYRTTQPYRYAIHLVESGRLAEARPILDAIVQSGSNEERAWAYIGLNAIDQASDDYVRAHADMAKAAAADPDNMVAWNDVASDEGGYQHDEVVLRADRQAKSLADRGGDAGLNPRYRPVLLPLIQANIDLETGDFQDVLSIARRIVSMPDNHSWENALVGSLVACGGVHDFACLTNAQAALQETKDPAAIINRDSSLAIGEAELERWHALMAVSPRLLADFRAAGKAGDFATPLALLPLLSLADAELGDFRAAHALADKTPLDCVICLRIRGRIDAQEKNWSGANYWFSRAAAAAPSIPFGDLDWGAALLAKGDIDGAIAKFEEANAKGPHFADPLEMWGEALIAKNRSDLALAKFEEADKYAPKWGRLHLKWGEALYYAGHVAESKRQIARATSLDLSQADRAALTAWVKAHG